MFQTRRIQLLAQAALLIGAPTLAALGPGGAKAKPRFFDRASQAAEFIGYSRSITLTAAQKAVRDRALGKLPAPCCSKFSAATCCCPCNLAKSVWGLSNYLIVREKATAGEVRRAAREWFAFVNPGGFSGDACDTGGCARKFSSDGCGGMDERNLLAAR
jgi:hypothetical protein